MLRMHGHTNIKSEKSVKEYTRRRRRRRKEERKKNRTKE
jgi:hypothetical protein